MIAPITMSKSVFTCALPFSQQDEHKQGYAGHHKNQSVAIRVRSFGTEHHIQRSEGHEKCRDLSQLPFRYFCTEASQFTTTDNGVDLVCC
jgi:hypothetical protein